MTNITGESENANDFEGLDRPQSPGAGYRGKPQHSYEIWLFCL